MQALLTDHWRVPANYRTALLCLIPVLFAALFSGKVMADLPQSKLWPSWAGSLDRIQGDIHSRAAVELLDDFRAGLDQWRARGDLAPAWAYDAKGFVRPGSLAVYRPSMHLKDYRLEFLAQVEQHAIGVAFRVKDWNNYYAFKLLSTQGGNGTLDIVRYRVADGREVDRVAKSVPTPLRNISMYRVILEVRGKEFTLMTQGQIADYWSDGKYPEGGVGFFGGKGEPARLRRVQVTHQADAIGKLCALIAPFDNQDWRLNRN